MFRLAHISDVHLSPIPKLLWWEYLSKRIVGYANWNKNRVGQYRRELLDIVVDQMMVQSPDHIAVTGDLVNIATRGEITNARLWLEELDAKADGNIPITAIAGNHDAYVPGSLDAVLKEWKDYISTADKAVLKASDFPLVRTHGNISIISCNSAEATFPFRATGFFRTDQALRLNAILKDHEGQFRIVLIHHLPVEGKTADYKRLVGANRFANCIHDHGAELVLHGHTHLQSLYWQQSVAGWVPIVGVSATSYAPGLRNPPGGFNLLEIDGAPGNWSCDLKRFGLSPSKQGTDMELIDEVVLTKNSEKIGK